MPTPGWLSHPDAVDAQVAAWAAAHPDHLLAESITQYAGRPVWAVTVTDRRLPDEPKRKLLTFKPHAHEPAPIAGQISAISMLLDGQTLDGRPTEFDNERILRDCLLTFILDANPTGTAQAPVESWDGSQYTNEELWIWMRGLDLETCRMWQRVDIWDERKVYPFPVRYGIVYEHVSEHEYVEPNRHHRSTLFQWLFRLFERHQWDLMLDLHQTEFTWNDDNCMVILPALFDEQPPEIQAAETALAQRLLDAWSSTEGAHPTRDFAPLGYTGQERQYFLNCWREFAMQCPIITSEIQNNNPRTPPWLQMRLNEIATREAVSFLVAASVLCAHK